MNKWYEILISSSVVSFALLFLHLDKVQPFCGKILAYFGTSVLPTAFFQIRNTKRVTKARLSDWVNDNNSITHWAWYLALIHNTILVCVIGMMLSMIYWFILTSLGIEVARPL